MNNLLSIFNFKRHKVFSLTALTILAIELSLFIYPQPVSCLSSYPTLASIFNHLADEASKEKHSFDVAILGDSTGLINIAPKLIEKKLDISCFNLSRTMHYGFAGLFECLKKSQQQNPQCNNYIIAMSLRLFVSDNDYIKDANYLPYYLKAYNIHHELFNPQTLDIPSIRYADDVKRTIFFNSQQKYYGNKSYDQWQSIHQQNKGQIPFKGTASTEQLLEETFKNYAHHLKKACLDNFSKMIQWSKNNHIQLHFIFSPIPHLCWQELTNQGWDTLIKQELTAFLSTHETSQFINDFFPIYPDEYFFDSIHLNEKGAPIFTQFLCDQLQLKINTK